MDTMLATESIWVKKRIMLPKDTFKNILCCMEKM